MKKEIRIFFTALMFLTRLPVPKFTDHSQEYLEKSARYFPLVGWIVALISGLTFLVFNKYVSEDIAILASIIAGIFTTGAFHEDGFAGCMRCFWRRMDKGEDTDDHEGQPVGYLWRYWSYRHIGCQIRC